MARGTKKKDDVEEVKSMDFAGGKRAYFEDIKPARSQASEHMQAVSTAMKHVKKHLNMVPGGYQVALKIFEMEEGKQEAFIRTLVGQFNEMKGREVLSHDFDDLVDRAQREDRYARPNLSVVESGPASDGLEDDFMSAANSMIDAMDDAEAVEAVETVDAPEKPKRAGRKATVATVSPLN